MFRRHTVNYAILSLALDASLTLLAWLAAEALRLAPPSLPFLQVYEPPGLPWFFYPLLPLLWIAVFLLLSVYDPRRASTAADEFQTVMVATAVASLCSAGLLFLSFRGVSRWLFIFFVLFDLLFLNGWRALALLARRLIKSPPSRSRVLIAGAGEVGQQIADLVRRYTPGRLELVGYLDDDPVRVGNGLPVLGTLDQAREIIQAQAVDEVVIALPRRAHERLGRLVTVLHDLPVHVRVVPDYFSLALFKAGVEDFAGVPMIDLRAPAINDVQRLFKRMFDLALGGAITLLALPVMGLVALAVKLDTRGPVLFRQRRAGENGRLFPMHKFRSMVADAEGRQAEVNELDEEGNLVFKKRDDPRITRVGRIIRRISLDELPQLFNVLRGDMSLVGPRPELPWLVDQYEPWQRRRFVVPQGITGWWQVNGRSEKSLELKTRDDLFYIQNYSLWLDLYILVRTPWIVLKGEGAF